MRQHCDEGARLCRRFTDNLKEWGFAEVDRRAVEMLPLGPIKLEEISQDARQTDVVHINARRAYAEHVANYLVCSRHLVLAERKWKMKMTSAQAHLLCEIHQTRRSGSLLSTTAK